MSGNFGGRIKGAKYRFVLQDGTWGGPDVEVVQLHGSQGFWQHQVLRGVGV